MDSKVSLKEWHEKILNKIVFYAHDLLTQEGVEEFAAEKHMHSFTEAFGKPEKRPAAKCIDMPAAIHFTPEEISLREAKNNRIFLKIVAMLEDWKKHICPIEIRLNENMIFNSEMLFENVCKGWPSNYIEIPAGLLSEKGNILEITNKSGKKGNPNPLYINRIAIIEMMSYPKPEGNSPIDPPLPPDALPLYAGGDTDDIRTDESGETEYFLQLLNDTSMGNYLIFRPKHGRNYFFPPKPATWKKRIEYCEKNDIYFRVTSWPLPGNPFPIEYLKGKKTFQGVHVHESYLLLQTINNPKFYEQRKKPSVDRFLNARDAEEGRASYIAHIKEEIKEYRELGVPIAFGEPSLLAPYLPIEAGDVIQAEPVGNSSFIFSETRAIAHHKGILWGAHIAIDWYLGFPHDRSASRRFKLMCNLCFTHGASWVYAENSLLETNAYERLDREDNFCRHNRDILRNFYRYSLAHPRRGTLKAAMAAVYGNLESILWHPDNRIPELKDTNNFDLNFWGKWEFTDNLWAWKALEGWLPPLSMDEFKDNPSMLKFFSGTPYGQVDVTPAGSGIENLKKYKCMVLLGWNTITSKIYEKLIAYVKAGGVLYISAYHLDTRKTPEAETSFINKGRVKELTGVEIKGAGENISNFKFNGAKFNPGEKELRLCRIETYSAKPFIIDSLRKPVMLENHICEGKVYFGNFYDFPCKGEMLEFNKSFLKWLGEKHSDSLIEYNEHINYSVWEENNVSRAYFINIDWKKEGNEKVFVLKLWDEKFRLSAKEGSIREMLFDNSCGITTEHPDVFLESIKRCGGEICITIKGSATCTFEFLCRQSLPVSITKNAESLKFESKGGKYIFKTRIKDREYLKFKLQKRVRQ